jgi:hypothetical protein
MTYAHGSMGAPLALLALLALLSACSTPSPRAPRAPGAPRIEAPHEVLSAPPTSGGDDAGASTPTSAESAPSATPATPPPRSAGATCASTRSPIDHPLALALLRDLKTPFATYACVFGSATDPDVAVAGFRVRALAEGAPFGPTTSYGERRWAFVERYAAELGLSASPHSELVIVPDELGIDGAMSMGGMTRMLQRAPGAWIGSDGVLDLELGVGAAPVVTSIDFAIVPNAAQLAQVKRASRKSAQEAAFAAARADGAIPPRLARKPTLALRTTTSGTALVYDFTVERVTPTLGGFTDGPTWLVRVDAATGKVASVRRQPE